MAESLLRTALRKHSLSWKQDWPAVRKLLPLIEKELAPFKARPHWGKLFYHVADELKSIYMRLPTLFNEQELRPARQIPQ